MAQNNVIKRLREVPSATKRLNVARFREEGKVQATTAGERSLLAKFEAPAATGLVPGQRVDLALPAYESFATDGTAGNVETFNLAHDLLDSPNTDNIVVWEGSTYVGGEAALDAVDYANDTFDYTDDGTNNTLHVYYISGESADVELVKTTPNAGGKSTQPLYNANLALVHSTNQSEQPERLGFSRSPLQGVVPTDWAVELYVDASYQVRFSDPDGDGTEPTNALLSFPARQSQQAISGLAATVKSDME
ncbi:hypothetical protein [Haladaptatus sp. DYF46]|uniref:hypothetical protein n=1 Tax=Haladaptatus sp. DYF46 TaxID=2886041 RepID=UPI001E3CD0D2|nr:hypothetical protein [Haladaptatus sp. DYF46]